MEVERYVYQRSVGGETFCPLERDARVVVTSTPRFAKIATHKMANGASTSVQRDLAENHGRAVSRCYLQDLSDAVGSAVAAKEEIWEYKTPKLDKPIRSSNVPENVVWTIGDLDVDRSHRGATEAGPASPATATGDC